jgi:tRNA(fMet)-specific endonuclease VapC
MPTVVLGELDAAFRLGRRLDDNRKRLDEFLHEDFVQVLPITAEVARRYGEVFVGLRRSGTPIPINDVWIAACTMDAAGHLATFDSDFMRVSALDHTLFEA